MKKYLKLWVWLSGVGLLCMGPFDIVAAQDPPPLFTELLLPVPAPVRFGEAAWGDYDADGDLDLFLSGNVRTFDRAEPFSQLYLNDGDGAVEIPDPDGGEVPIRVPTTEYVSAFNVGVSILENAWQSTVAWGDYDRDGDLDVLVSGIVENGSYTTRLYTNIGFPRFFESSFSWPGVASGDLDWGDYDNDGDLDVVVSGTDQSGRPVSEIYENQIGIGGGFVQRDVGLIGLTSSSVEWGDYDTDGDLDLLITGIAEPQAFIARVYRNDGNGLFTDIAAGLKGLLYASAAWGDYDADGDLDIVLNGGKLTPFILEGTLKMYRNDGGFFTDVSDGIMDAFGVEGALGRYQGNVAWGDFDNDGYLDFLVTGSRGPQYIETGQVYKNFLNDQFRTSRRENFGGGIFGTAFWGDYDGDNDLDIFVVGEKPGEGTVIRSLRNSIPRPDIEFGRINTPPTAPGGLQATPQAGSVTLSWEAAADAQTPPPGLTYNLRVGSTPGGVDVVSPMATADGTRLLPTWGNAGHRIIWTLTNLPPGTYYWSVQAVDNGFKGSPFAPEGTFTIDG
ncbi:MAG: FG-GAP-like repeat-containing protein [Rhodothermales bacterium]